MPLTGTYISVVFPMYFYHRRSPGLPHLSAVHVNAVYVKLGVPIAEHKQDGPSTCIVFLGIGIDTIAGELPLPADKLHRLEALLH